MAFCSVTHLSYAQPDRPPLPCSQLFFTEIHVDVDTMLSTAIHNIAVEIFNPTNDTIDLSGYTLQFEDNFSITPITLVGHINPKECFVVADSQAAANLQSLADQLNGGLEFEPYSSMTLVDPDDVILDRIGFQGNSSSAFDVQQYMQDPSSYLSTFNLTLADIQSIDLRRGMTVQLGDPSFSYGDSTFFGQWSFHLASDLSNLGTYKGLCNLPENEIVIQVRDKFIEYLCNANDPFYSVMPANARVGIRIPAYGSTATTSINLKFEPMVGSTLPPLNYNFADPNCEIAWTGSSGSPSTAAHYQSNNCQENWTIPSSSSNTYIADQDDYVLINYQGYGVNFPGAKELYLELSTTTPTVNVDPSAYLMRIVTSPMDCPPPSLIKHVTKETIHVRYSTQSQSIFSTSTKPLNGRIYNAMGQMVLQQSIFFGEHRLSNLPPGIYYLYVENQQSPIKMLIN